MDLDKGNNIIPNDDNCALNKSNAEIIKLQNRKLEEAADFALLKELFSTIQIKNKKEINKK